MELLNLVEKVKLALLNREEVIYHDVKMGERTKCILEYQFALVPEEKYLCSSSKESVKHGISPASGFSGIAFRLSKQPGIGTRQPCQIEASA